MFDWNDLKAFLALARNGSTLAAARALQINQTTVTRRIEALEAAVGLRLVERAQSGARLTQAGLDLLPEAERMEQAADAFANRAAVSQRDLTGALRVTSTEILANLVLTPALGEFRRRYPDLRVELILTDEPLDLEGGQADVAIRGGLAMPSSDLVARKLASFQVAVYASIDYVRGRGIPATAAELADHDLIVGDGVRSALPGVAWMLQNAPGAEPVFRSNSMASMLQALRAGLGVGPLIRLIGDREPDLVAGLQIPDLAPTAWVVAPRQMTETPRVRAFIDFIVPHFAAMRKALEAEGAAARTSAHAAAALSSPA